MRRAPGRRGAGPGRAAPPPPLPSRSLTASLGAQSPPARETPPLWDPYPRDPLHPAILPIIPGGPRPLAPPTSGTIQTRDPCAWGQPASGALDSPPPRSARPRFLEPLLDHRTPRFSDSLSPGQGLRWPQRAPRPGAEVQRCRRGWRDGAWGSFPRGGERGAELVCRELVCRGAPPAALPGPRAARRKLRG